MRRRGLVAAGFVLVYLWAFPYFARLRSANELPRIFLTEEIALHRTFTIDARMGELGSTFDVSTTPDGHHYSNKAPGVSFLAIPAFLLLLAWHKLTGGAPSLMEATWAFRVSAVTLPALIFLPWFVRGARRFAGPGDPEGPSGAALAAYALGSMALPYALLFMSHQTAAVCAGGAFLAAVSIVREETARPARAALVCGVLAGVAVLVDYQAAIAAAAVGVYLLVRSPAAQRVRVAAIAAAGAAPSAIALALYHRACFGSPLKTGYSFAVDEAHKHGVLGVIGPNARAMWNALLAPDNGLIVLSPWVLLAGVGVVAIARDREARARVGAEAIVCGAVLFLYVLFVGSLEPEFGRAGWSVGPRYIACAIPFAAWLAAAGLGAVDSRPAARTVAQALIAVGVIVNVVAATTYPHWPTVFRNPLFEVSLHALRAGLAPHSVGTFVGLRGALSLAPLFAMVAGLVVVLLARRQDRVRLATTVAALGLALAVVFAGYRVFPRTGTAAEHPWQFIRSTWEPPAA